MKNILLGIEVVWLLFKNGFDYGYCWLEWKCDLMNVVLCCVVEWLGFSWEGCLWQRLVCKGWMCDSDMLFIIDGEWFVCDVVLWVWLVVENFIVDGQQIKCLEVFC